VNQEERVFRNATIPELFIVTAAVVVAGGLAAYVALDTRAAAAPAETCQQPVVLMGDSGEVEDRCGEGRCTFSWDADGLTMTAAK
jgi:hypothetical protein